MARLMTFFLTMVLDRPTHIQIERAGNIYEELIGQ